jgi:hypothetical protein
VAHSISYEPLLKAVVGSYMQKVAFEGFDVNDSDDDMSIGSPLFGFPGPRRRRKSSTESIPSGNPLVTRLLETLSFKKDDPKTIDFFTYLVLSLYFLRGLSCWVEEKCHYDPLDDLELLVLANLNITWSHDFYNMWDYLANPRRLIRNYNPTIRSSTLALVLRIYGAYQVQQQMGSILADSKPAPLTAQLIACGTMEAYSRVFVALNSKFRAIEEVQPMAPAILFRQFTGEHDNSSDDDLDSSNPNTPSASPGLWPYQ